MALLDKCAQVTITPDPVAEGGAHIPLMGFGVFFIEENACPGVVLPSALNLTDARGAIPCQTALTTI